MGLENDERSYMRATVAVASLEGVLLRSRSPFPYYLLVALEAGSPLRAILLLLLWPLIWLAWQLSRDESLATRILIFFSTAGLKLSDVIGVSQAVLPKHYLEDLGLTQSYQLFASCNQRYVLTSAPRVMVEYFLKAHVGVNGVFGSELGVTRGGYCTGLVAAPGVLVGKRRAEVVRKLYAGEQAPDVGLGGGPGDAAFLALCKEKLVFGPAEPRRSAPLVPREAYKTPLIFHDGRLVARPTPLSCLVVLLWAPFGLALALVRIMASCLPMEAAFPCSALLGVKVRVKGAPPLPLSQTASPGGGGEERRARQGILFACTHRSLMDGTFLSVALRRPVRALTYSLSPVSEMIAPIRTARLTRNREQDARLIAELLDHDEDLFICPEGTTCREPYLLRFSSLFAELTEHIVPVAARAHTSMFHGTSARGFKSLDAFFFLMNPRPAYDVLILDRLPLEHTVAGGRMSSVQVAKLVQSQLAGALGFTCTDLTRKDKYTFLAGNDGSVNVPKRPPKPAEPPKPPTEADAVVSDGELQRRKLECSNDNKSF